MIKIKDIIWQERHAAYSGVYYSAEVNGITFLQIHSDRNNKWYIHTTMVGFDVIGNNGINAWGWMELEECKIKAEHLIYDLIISYIDIRDYKLNEVIK